MIRSAVAGNIELVELDLVQRQVIFALGGVVAMLVVAAIDYRLWASISRPLFIGTVIALAVLTIVGAALFGSARWFDTGVILIQPSEIAKIVLILVLADYFTRNQHKIQSLSYVFRSFVLAMGITVPILLQPNLSTSIVMIVLWFALLWASGLRMRHLLLFIAGGIFLPILAFPFLVDYQQRRILNFLFPDPNARHGDIYNIQQALISIGSGGLLGQGYGQGTQVQLRFLKVRWSDFIFSAMAHEFGFIGTLVVILMLAVRHLALPARGPPGRRYLRRVDCLWRGDDDHLPGDRQYRRQSEPDARYRLDFAFCQLWGQFPALHLDRHRTGGERDPAPPIARILNAIVIVYAGSILRNQLALPVISCIQEISGMSHNPSSFALRHLPPGALTWAAAAPRCTIICLPARWAASSSCASKTPTRNAMCPALSRS